MKNDFEVKGDTILIYLNSRVHGRKVTIIDADDLPKAQQLPGTWHVKWDKYGKSFYVHGNIKTSDGKQTKVQLHRWITEAPKHLYVDHKNHNTLDNRRKVNLRLCSITENTRNRKGFSWGSSKYKGVSWVEHAKKYSAKITADKRIFFLGYFESEIEAAEAYNKAALKYHGEFASINEI